MIALSFLSLVFQTALLTIFQYFSEENNSTRFNSTDLISISEGSAQAAVKFGLYFFFIPFVLGFIGSVILGAFKIAQTNYANHLDDNKHIIDFLVHLDLDITIPEEIKKASKDSIDLSSEQRAKLKKLIMGVIEINKSLVDLEAQTAHSMAIDKLTKLEKILNLNLSNKTSKQISKYGTFASSVNDDIEMPGAPATSRLMCNLL